MTGWIALIIAIVLLSINVYMVGRYHGYLKGYSGAVARMNNVKLDKVKDILEKGEQNE